MIHFYSASNVLSQHFNLENTVINSVLESSTCIHNLLAEYRVKQFPVKPLNYHNCCL